MKLARNRIVALGLTVVLATTMSAAAGSAEEELPYTLVEASPTVIMALHDNGSNIACVALDGGLVFFDASLSTRTASLFRRAMETFQETRRPR